VQAVLEVAVVVDKPVRPLLLPLLEQQTLVAAVAAVSAPLLQPQVVPVLSSSRFPTLMLPRFPVG
jgi:hypothetical protein